MEGVRGTPGPHGPDRAQQVIHQLENRSPGEQEQAGSPHRGQDQRGNVLTRRRHSRQTSLAAERLRLGSRGRTSRAPHVTADGGYRRPWPRGGVPIIPPPNAVKYD
ncbi:hypothetical protein NHX12_010958 [Muraenolepis orangiensis]|uniref:Uncharacterized protein n=1 Tax=Muraenolepis orangiensis TaxID=630683 RepID=A0A9Q0DI07_9TELE|nr:hypothetical protein NHX12_010958 [Muraenolepis orangiensis]